MNEFEKPKAAETDIEQSDLDELTVASMEDIAEAFTEASAEAMEAETCIEDIVDVETQIESLAEEYSRQYNLEDPEQLAQFEQELSELEEVSTWQHLLEEIDRYLSPLASKATKEGVSLIMSEEVRESQDEKIKLLRGQIDVALNQINNALGVFIGSTAIGAAIFHMTQGQWSAKEQLFMAALFGGGALLGKAVRVWETAKMYTAIDRLRPELG